MYEDEPQDRVHDVLAEAIYGDHPLGRRVLGPRRGDRRRSRSPTSPPTTTPATRPTTSSSPPPATLDHEAHRRARRSAPSSRRPATAARTADGRLERRERPARLLSEGDRAVPHLLRRARDRPRATSAASRSPCSTPIFGGSVSSRLFREVREKRGLAYSVGSYTHEFVDTGFVAMYVGTRADNVAEACEIIGRELVKLSAEGVSDDELARAKEHVKGRMVLGLESTSARMGRLARAMMFDVPLLSLDEMLERVDAVDHRRGRRARRPSSTTQGSWRPPASGRTRTASRPPRVRFRRLSWRDPGRGFRRRRTHGGHGLRGGRGGGRHGAHRPRRPGARHDGRRHARRRRRRRRLQHARDGDRQRRRLRRRRRARRGRHDGLRPRASSRRSPRAARPTSSWRRTSRSGPC